MWFESHWRVALGLSKSTCLRWMTTAGRCGERGTFNSESTPYNRGQVHLISQAGWNDVMFLSCLVLCMLLQYTTQL